MDIEIIAGIKVMHVLGVLFVVAILGVARKMLLGKEEVADHQARRKCPSCGWMGAVSKYKPTCPSCAKPL